MRAALDAGLAVDDFAPRLSFFFVARTTLLEEVAKFRAARRIWARLMRDEFGAQDPKSLMLRFHTQTAGVQLTAQQPEVNLVRVAVQALGAVLGGTQSLHTNSYDEAIALPTEKAARLALRTQQVLAYETDLTATVDPFAGSYAVEAMTDEIEAAAVALMERVAELRLGGRRDRGRASRSGRSSSRRTGSRRRSTPASGWWSGVNRFALDEEEPYEPLRVDPAIEAAQAERLAELRAERDAGGGRRGRWPTLRTRRRGHGQRAATRCRRRCGPGPRWARSATRCARCGGCTGPPTGSDRSPAATARVSRRAWRGYADRADVLTHTGVRPRSGRARVSVTDPARSRERGRLIVGVVSSSPRLMRQFATACIRAVRRIVTAAIGHAL